MQKFIYSFTEKIHAKIITKNISSVVTLRQQKCFTVTWLRE